MRDKAAIDSSQTNEQSLFHLEIGNCKTTVADLEFLNVVNRE
jgi:hypothetical protein